MNLINADPIMEQLEKKKSSVPDSRYIEGFNDAVLRFRSMLHKSSRVDAVPVVRCKDCEYYIDGICEKIEYIMDGYYRDTFEIKRPDDFCSYGEKKG